MGSTPGPAVSPDCYIRPERRGPEVGMKSVHGGSVFFFFFFFLVDEKNFAIDIITIIVCRIQCWITSSIDFSSGNIYNDAWSKFWHIYIRLCRYVDEDLWVRWNVLTSTRRFDLKIPLSHIGNGAKRRARVGIIVHRAPGSAVGYILTLWLTRARFAQPFAIVREWTYLRIREVCVCVCVCIRVAHVSPYLWNLWNGATRLRVIQEPKSHSASSDAEQFFLILERKKISTIFLLKTRTKKQNE